GGTTTVVDYCTPPPGASLMSGLEDWHRRRANACVDVGAHMIVLDAGAATLAEMKTLVEREGISSFKFFMAYPGALMLEDGALFTALRAAGALGALSCVHAENGPVIQSLVQAALAQGQTALRHHALTRPALLEGEATQRAIDLAELAQAPLYVVHRPPRRPCRQCSGRGSVACRCMPRPARSTCCWMTRSARRRL
ncbi:MAG: hypothetical protein IPP44_12770, partial [Ideonella sp.]|nr:hypothetical protein [Ideonella sp.]